MKLTGFSIDEIEELGFTFKAEGPMEFGDYYKVYSSDGLPIEYTLSYNQQDEITDFTLELMDYEIKKESMNNTELKRLINLLKKALEL